MCSLGVMTKPEDKSRGERLKAAREAYPFARASEAARWLGVKEPTYLAHENGSRGFTSKDGDKYASRFKVDYTWLMTGRGSMKATKYNGPVTFSAVKPDLNGRALTTINVIGSIQAGVWVEALEWPQRDQYELDLPIPQRYQGAPVVAFEVHGPSMDMVYPDGSVVVCVKFLDLGRRPRHMERVVALRQRNGEMEATIKEYRIDSDGTARLWPRSTHPQHQTPTDLRPGDDDLQVAYLVIGSYRPET